MQAGKNLGIPGKNHLSQVELGKGLQSGPGGKNKKNSNHEPRTRELNETSKLVPMEWNEYSKLFWLTYLGFYGGIK